MFLKINLVPFLGSLNALADSLAEAIKGSPGQPVKGLSAQEWNKKAIYVHGESAADAARRAEDLKRFGSPATSPPAGKLDGRFWLYRDRETPAEKAKLDQLLMSCPARSLVTARN